MSAKQQLEEAVEYATKQFLAEVCNVYSTAGMRRKITDACEKVDRSGFNMKSKYRKKLFETVEVELPMYMKSELEKVVDDVVNRLWDKVGTIVSKDASCSAALKTFREKLKDYKDKINEELVKEELRVFQRNLAIAGVAAVGVGGIAVGVGVAVGEGIAIGPVGWVLLAGAAVAAPAIYGGYELAWDAGTVQEQFISDCTADMVQASRPEVLSQNFEALLKRAATVSLEGPKSSGGGTPAAAAHHAASEAVFKKVAAAKKYTVLDNILWHDPNIANKENQTYMEQLKKNYPNILGCDSYQQAALRLEENPLTAFTVITSGRNADTLMPLIQNRINVKAIHVFCFKTEKYENQPWFMDNLSPAGKILSIRTNIMPLVNDLAKPPPAPRFMFLKADAVAKSLDEAARVYVHSKVQNYVDGLSFEDAVMHLLQVRQTKHPKLSPGQDDITRLVRIFNPLNGCCEELLTEYTEEKTHVYDTLNFECREKHRNYNFLKVAKLAEQYLFAMQSASIKHPGCVYNGTVYRGVRIPDGEENQWQASVGDVVFFRAFTSTSRLESKASEFAERAWKQKGGKKLMLKIDLSSLGSDVQCVRPLYIKKFSKFPSEEEVLIPLLAGFRIQSVSSDTDDWVRVNLELAFAMPDVTAAFIYAFI